MGDERTLTDADAEAVAMAIVHQARGVDGCLDCPYNDKQVEWVETGEKYIPSKSLPALGKFSIMLDNLEKEVGMWVIRAVFILGGGSGLIFILVKVGWIKIGGGK